MNQTTCPRRQAGRGFRRSARGRKGRATPRRLL